MKPEELYQAIDETEEAQLEDYEPKPKPHRRWAAILLAACLALAVIDALLPAADPAPAEPDPVLEEPALEPPVTEVEPEPEPEPETELESPSHTLDPVIQELMAQYGLNESNFSLCYYNTVTGESYKFNPDAWMVAASTYKLPLNLYYYEQEAAGLIDPESYISGIALPDIHYRSIVESNNELSHVLLYNLGTFSEYKQLMLETYSDYDLSQVPAEAMKRNLYTTGFMMDVLQYLYPIADQYPELMDYLNQAMPGLYFEKYVTDYPIAHKYGSYDGAENDIGIIYTEEPYLLSVYTYGVYNGMDVVGRINEAICNYNVSHYQPEPQPEPKPESEPEPVPEPEPEPLPAEEPDSPDPAASWLTGHPLTLAGLIGAALCLLWLCLPKRK